jgi:hypothetical protein
VYHLEHHIPNFWNPINFKTTWDSFKEDFSFQISYQKTTHVM